MNPDSENGRGKQIQSVETNRQIQDIFKSHDYQFIRKLGDGTFGDVFEMMKPDKTTVAVKFIASEKLSKAEISHWPHLNHPHVQSLLEIFFAPDVFVYGLAMPLQNTTLAVKVKSLEFTSQPTALEHIKMWLCQILQGLQYLHQQGLAHLDMKMNNVLISSEQKAIISNFSFLESTDFPVTRYGLSKQLCPPEACSSWGSQFPVSGIAYDLWTTGLLAVNALTGEVFNKNLLLNQANWSQKTYPLLYEMLQEKQLKQHIKAALPMANLDKGAIKCFRNFALMFLRLHPDHRPSAEQALNHEFLGGTCMGDEDIIWMRKIHYSNIETFVANYRIRLSHRLFTKKRHLIPHPKSIPLTVISSTYNSTYKEFRRNPSKEDSEHSGDEMCNKKENSDVEMIKSGEYSSDELRNSKGHSDREMCKNKDNSDGVKNNNKEYSDGEIRDSKEQSLSDVEMSISKNNSTKKKRKGFIRWLQKFFICGRKTYLN